MPATYFLAPTTWNVSPDEVKLGSVIGDINSPQSPISDSALLASIDTPLPPPTEDKNPSGTARRSKEWSAGLFATLIQLTVGGELSHSTNSTLTVEYSCESIATRRFKPSLEYIDKATRDAGVSSHLKIGGLGSKAFMVTGIKVAHKATITVTEEGGRETTTQLGIEIPAIFLKIGPKWTRKTSDHRQITTTVEGPFVFAFEIEKLCVSLKGNVSSKAFVKGAMLSKGDVPETEMVIECQGQALDEDEEEDFGVVCKLGKDDNTGEGCTIVTPI